MNTNFPDFPTPAVKKNTVRGGVFLLAMCMITMAGFGGTTVFAADKTVTYKESTYDLSNVDQVNPREEIELASGEVIEMRNKGKDELEPFFKENPGAKVSMIIDLDDQELVYLRMNVKNYEEYHQLRVRFDKALEEIRYFMGHNAHTHLQLK